MATGTRFFNEHRFFEAHEALEEIWLKERGAARDLLHGLIQLSAAFHHYSRGNLSGFSSLLKKGVAKLEGCEHAAQWIDLATFQEELVEWRHFAAALEQDPEAEPPPWPRIRAGSPPLIQGPNPP